jgi:hypothetical protein
MQERLAAINARLDVTESETARLAAERLSFLKMSAENWSAPFLWPRMSSTRSTSRRPSLVAVNVLKAVR